MQRAARSHPQQPQNLLLAALPPRDYRRLAPHLEPVSLVFGQVLYEPGMGVKHAYFPCDSVISLLAVASPGKSAEVAMVGREGVVGGFAALGVRVSQLQAVVQRTGTALRIASSQLQAELGGSGVWFREAFRLTHTLMNQAAQSAVCNRFHTVEGRLARWLLTTRDRMQSNHFRLTHAFLSLMVGARRVGITSAAAEFQRRGLITYVRGNIQILNPGGLKSAACACYAANPGVERTVRRR